MKKIPSVDEIKIRCTTDENSCWTWQGARSSNGYGHITVRNKTLQTHTIMYNHFKGSIPKGLDIDHLCRNRACCNPEHMEVVTRSINLMRGARGKLTSEKIEEILKNGKLWRTPGPRFLTYTNIGKRYGVSGATIFRFLQYLNYEE